MADDWKGIVCPLVFSSAWKTAIDMLENGESVVLIGPKFYGKNVACRGLLTKSNVASNVPRYVTLSSRTLNLEGRLSFSRLWEDVRGQLRIKASPKIPVVDSTTFAHAFTQRLIKGGPPIVCLVVGAGRGNEQNHLELLRALHRLLVNSSISGKPCFQVLAIDDYSTFHYHPETHLSSDLHWYSNIHLGALSENEVRDCIISAVRRQGKSLADSKVISIANMVFNISGGHPQLVGELVDELNSAGWINDFGEKDWAILRDGVLRRSAVLESMSMVLEEDLEGYTTTALEYTTASPSKENSPRIHILRQIGVLVRDRPPLIRLASGAVRELIEQYSIRIVGEIRVGTIVPESGPRMWESGNVVPSEDDFVVLHLSDIHVGEGYKHRLAWGGKKINPNDHSAGELLRHDIDSLHLLGRIDAVVISGDFVWKASADEFRRAREVIAEIADQIKVPTSHMLFVAGNHDVEWNPSALGMNETNAKASLENYNDFLTYLKVPGSAESSALLIPNRAKTSVLRIMGLNSNHVEGPEAGGIGFVSRDSLTAVKEAIGCKIEQDVPCINWLVVHHHVFPSTSASVVDAASRKVSVMANAADVLARANEWKVEVILHGHEHQPSVTVARRWSSELAGSFSPISSIGAGSFGGARDSLGPFARNQYYIVIRRTNGILLRSRATSGTGLNFVGDCDLWLPTG